MNPHSIVLPGGQTVPALTVEYDEATINIGRILEAQFNIRAPSGAWPASLEFGDEVEVRRGAEPTFQGFVTTKGRRIEGSEGGVLANVGLEEKWQRRLLRHTCHGYIDGQDAPGNSLRDSAYIALWKWDEPLRDPASTLDEDGLPPVALAVTHREAVRAIFGFSHTWLMRMDEDAWLRPEDLTGASGKAVVATDQTSELLGITRPWNENGYIGAAATIETRALRAANPNLRATGPINQVSVVLVGQLDDADPGDAHPTVRACRNADEVPRAYADIPLVHVPNYQGTTMDAWVGTIDLTSTPSTQKDAAALEVTINGTDQSQESTRIWAIKATAETTNLLGFTEGTIDEYTDPNSVQAREWIIDDYQDLTLLQAAQRVQESTESRDAVNPSPHWDLWWSPDGTVEFQERRGDNLNATYTDQDARVKELEANEDAGMIAYQMYGLGAGEGRNRIQLTDDTPYSAGGLRIEENDPDGDARFGEQARTLVYRDQSIKSLPELRRRTRAALSLYREPLLNARLKLATTPARLFTAGDTVAIQSAKTGVNGRIRITHIRRRQGSGAQEEMDVELGEPRKTNVQRMGEAQAQDMRQQGNTTPRNTVNPVSGPGYRFSKDKWARIPLLVTDGGSLEDFEIRLEAQPWQFGIELTEEVAAVNPGIDAATTGENTDLDAQVDDQTVYSLATTNLVLEVTVPTALNATFKGALALIALRNETGTGAQDYDWTLENVTQATTVASGTLSDVDDGERASTQVQLDTTDVDEGDLLRLTIDTGNFGTAASHPNSAAFLHIRSLAEHTHTTTVPAHAHSIVPALSQFEVDDAPVFCQGIEWGVDVTVDDANTPTNWANEKHSIEWGNEDFPETLRAKILHLMDTDGNGRVRNDIHYVYVKSRAGTTKNPSGLGVASGMGVPQYQSGGRQ